MQLLSIFLLALGATNVTWAAPSSIREAAREKVSRDHITAREPTKVVAYLYKDSWQKGGSFIIMRPTDGKCHNLPTEWNDVVSSAVVNLGYNCFFYTDANCQGFSREFSDTNGWNFDLSTISLNDKMSSYLCTGNGWGW